MRMALMFATPRLFCSVQRFVLSSPSEARAPRALRESIKCHLNSASPTLEPAARHGRRESVVNVSGYCLPRGASQIEPRVQRFDMIANGVKSTSSPHVKHCGVATPEKSNLVAVDEFRKTLDFAAMKFHVDGGNGTTV